MTARQRHVTVVGAGIVGLSAAYALVRDGHAVTVIERGSRDRDGASFGNAGIVVPSHFVPLAAPGVVVQGLRWLTDRKSPFYVRPRLSLDLVRWGVRFWRSCTEEHVDRSAPAVLALNLRSRALYEELVAELDAELSFAPRGLLMLCATERGLEEEARIAEMANGLGLAATVLDRDEVAAMEPNIDMDVVGAVHVPEDANLDPGAVMRGLQDYLERRGVTFRYGRRLTRIDVDGERVRTIRLTGDDAPGEVIETEPVEELVLASGAWSRAFGRDLGLSLLLEPGKGYSITIDEPSQNLRTAAILSEARASATNVGGRLRIGGTMEIGGFRGGLDPVRLQGLQESAQRYFPKLSSKELSRGRTWWGYRPCSADGLPYLGRSPRHRNVVIATGHAMMGFSAAPATGEVIADLISNRKARIPIEPFAVDRHT